MDEHREEERLILARLELLGRPPESEEAPGPKVEADLGNDPVVGKTVTNPRLLPRPSPSHKQRRREPSDNVDAWSEETASTTTAMDDPLEAWEDKETFYDDGDADFYQNRLGRWAAEVSIDEADVSTLLDCTLAEQNAALSFPDLMDTGVSRLRAPRSVWNRLLEYQREGVGWMLDLYRQEVGGILGDEMGLGKTIQVIAFIATLHVSRQLDKPVLVLCPATVMKQWVKEFHAWWPMLRVTLLHPSGRMRDDLARALKVACVQGHVVVTSYGHLQHRSLGKKILAQAYAAAILDEGHKIRNPNAEITTLCKQLQTPRRIILSGTPIQNNLIELWSLMDFVYPGRLGSLSVFKTEIALPINAGGYVSASSLQVQTSYRCACILKDLISPYLLRRVKADVAQGLPDKQEQVLFCQLTDYQHDLYQHYIQSEDVGAILSGVKNILAGIDILRKICNHPDLLRLEDDELHALTHIEPPTDPLQKSGKLNVLRTILDHWQKNGHRVLLFCQTRQMLDIVETFVIAQGYPYFRMDGTTPIVSRMALVDEYNANGQVFLFLLTTRVGGLGVNLTGADRVLIYDPDWNPSTDMQARERAWRLGQTRPVTIYRMLTVGTIEEKIYHRQIFKQYLTNRILADPKQTRFFKTSDLYDLFSLGTSGEPGVSETGDLLAGLEEGSRTMGASTEHILDGIMEVTGLHSALEHDRLIERPQREIALVEREAQKRASEAIEALQRSREASSQSPVRPLVGLSAGLSSSSIMASIRRRQLALAQDESVKVTIPLGQEPLQQVVNQLLDLFTARHGKCSSDAIATKFSYISGEDAVAFRQILRTIATLDNRGNWHLKLEFLPRLPSS